MQAALDSPLRAVAEQTIALEAWTLRARALGLTEAQCAELVAAVRTHVATVATPVRSLSLLDDALQFVAATGQDPARWVQYLRAGVSWRLELQLRQAGESAARA